MRSGNGLSLSTHSVTTPRLPPADKSPLFAFIIEYAGEGLDPFQLEGARDSLAEVPCAPYTSGVAAREMCWELIFSASHHALTLERRSLKAVRTAEPEIIGAVGIQGLPESWFFVMQGTNAPLPDLLNEFREEFGGINPTRIAEQRARHCVGVLLRAFETLTNM